MNKIIFSIIKQKDVKAIIKINKVPDFIGIGVPVNSKDTRLSKES